MTVRELHEAVSGSDDRALIERWAGFSPLEKAAAFKLMPKDRAFAFFRQLPFGEQYHLIGAAPHGSIAPLLEDAGPAVDSLFHRLSREDVHHLIDVAMDSIVPVS